MTAAEFIAELNSDPGAYDFFHAVRMIENIHPEQPRIGYSLTPAQDPVRFGQTPSLAFAPATVGDIEPLPDTRPSLLAGNAADSGRPPKLVAHFFGMLGPNGPLPLRLTEFIRNRARGVADPEALSDDAPAGQTAERRAAVKDPTLALFLDIFHHRMASFLYRARAMASKATDYDRPGEARHPAWTGSLLGIGSPGLRDRADTLLPDRAKLFFAGHLANQTRHPEGLRKILEDYFQVPVEVIEFIGAWLPLPPENLCQLGDDPDTGALGETLVIGDAVWSPHHTFRLRLGPLDYADFQRFLPPDPDDSAATPGALAHLREWVRFHSGETFDCQVQLVLKREEVPDPVLGESGQLGLTLWSKDAPGPVARDAEDLLLTLSF